MPTSFRYVNGCARVVTVQTKPYDFLADDGQQQVGANFFVHVQDESGEVSALKLRKAPGGICPDYDTLDSLVGTWINYRERIEAASKLVRGEVVQALTSSLAEWSPYEDEATSSNGRRAKAAAAS